MQLATVRSPLQLLCSILLARSYSNSSLIGQTGLSLCIYLAIAIFIVLPFRLFVYPAFFSPLRSVPSPPPGLNNWRTWLVAEPSPPQLLAWLKATAESHGDSFQGLMRYSGIGGGERILLVSSESLKGVLVTKQYSHFDLPSMARKRFAIQVGNGLIASGGDAHKHQKRKLVPAFSSRAIKDLYPLFWSKANELIASLDRETQSSRSATVEILSWTSRSALDIIGVAAWGRDFEAISHPDSDFLKAYAPMFDISGGGQLVIALSLVLPMSLVLQIPLPYNKRLKKALSFVRATCGRAVDEKLITKEGVDNKDILSLLIRGGVDDREALVNQMMTMLAAGHDTSSLSLTWGSFLLCRNPHVQTRLRNELLTVFSQNQQDVHESIPEDTLESLPYLHAVANEILRLMPSVPLVRRETLEETTICGHQIPKGTQVVACSWVVNRLQSEWGSHAEDFIPERWLDKSEAKNENEEKTTGVNNKFAFHSFSHGPRSCIGQGFARGELLVFLAALVGNFKMELENPDEEPVALFGITMSPAGGIRIRLSKV